MNALTALEALLLNESKTELTYRLSMRVAHLLGTDAISRRDLFRDMKGFYDLRSAIVHGNQIKSKHRSQMERSDYLREIVRRTLIAVIALLSDNMNKTAIEEILDEIILDEMKRLEVQRIVMQFSLLYSPSAPMQ